MVDRHRIEHVENAKISYETYNVRSVGSIQLSSLHVMREIASSMWSAVSPALLWTAAILQYNIVISIKFMKPPCMVLLCMRLINGAET